MPRTDLTLQAPVPAEPGRWHRPLPWLLLGSVALHALVLAWQVPATPLQLAEPAGRSAPLGLQLTHAAAEPRKAIAEPAAAPSSEPDPAPVETTAESTPAAHAKEQRDSTPARRTAPRIPAPAAPADQEPTKAPVPRPLQTATASGPRPEAAAREQRAALTDSSQRSAVLSEIRDALQRHFFYPRLARLRNWEGNVLLGFQIHSDGRIEDIQVLESSGRAVLDQAAMRALRSVRQVAYNATRPVDLQLPVAYRLH